MPTFYVHPSPRRGEIDYGVIKYIIEQHQRMLPKFGWQEVDTEDQAALVVGHLGTPSERIDVFHLHGLYPTGMINMPTQCWAANAVLVENLRRARNIIAVSDWVAESIRREMHIDPFVLGHGIDLGVWAKVPVARRDSPYILWNKSRLLGVCDPTVVVELARRLPEQQFITTFLPEGQAPLGNVETTGTLAKSQMWPLVKGAAAYLATTKETFGIGTLEAMVSGVPIVGFDWGNVPPVLADCGILVEPYDYDGLRDALLEAWDRRKELATKGKKRVKAYTWRSVIERLSDMYMQCIPNNEPRGPKVTVVIPCRNYAQFVTEAIDSVQAQTFEDWELFIVDDGSDDDSASAIRQAIADEPRAVLISQENQGVAFARNNGIAQGIGQYISCLDADDRMAPTFLEKMVAVLDEEPKLGLVYSGLRIINDKGELTERVHSWPKQYDPEKGMDGNQVPTLNMYRRDIWERLGGYRQRYAPHGAGIEDADFWCRIAAYGAGVCMVNSEGLFHYRVHRNSATRRHPDDWKVNSFYEWYSWRQDGKQPFASQLGVPENGSWPVRDYDRPRISVVVPVGPYHRKHMINALDSVEAQTYRYWELVVINDTGEPLNTKAWPFAKVLDTAKKGMGPGHGRNLGTQKARAPLVVYLDADDVLQPTFMEDTLRLWLEIGGWIYTDFFYVKPDGAHRVYQCHEWESERLWEKGMAAVTGLYPIQAWKDVGGFDESIPHEDWEFHIKLALAGWCGSRLSKPLITYRHDTGQRREECIEEKGFIAIKRRYSKEALMGCNCGKGGGVRSAKLRRPAPPPTVREMTRRIGLGVLDPETLPAQPGDGYQLMVYMGKSATDLLFKGRMQKYLFSTKRRLAWVHPLDIGRLERKAVLKRITTEDLKAAAGPELAVPEKVH